MLSVLLCIATGLVCLVLLGFFWWAVCKLTNKVMDKIVSHEWSVLLLSALVGLSMLGIVLVAMTTLYSLFSA